MITIPIASTAPGSPTALGAHVAGDVANFALFSAHADMVELCLFDDRGFEHRVPIEHRTNNVWHAQVAGVGPGQEYGYRVHGRWDPAAGLYFDPEKLLIDPYARALAATVDWSGPFEGAGGREFGIDNANWMPRSLVVDESFDWQDDRAPSVPWPDTLIYELHVKGFTKLHPGVPKELRGRYGALGHPAAIEHFKRLGVTAVELLPVQAFPDDRDLVRRGLANLWGYNTIGSFAPEARYSELGDRGGQVVAFKRMVRSLHAAGIEVILDVVYNHTAEGGDDGPTLSFRGIDNPSYYHLSGETPRRHLDWTGTGNSLRVSNPPVLRVIMDSLRYWVEEMHVDGFRFDLATELGRDERGFSENAAFFAAVHQDPVLSRVKLIAEPWDLGDGGYRAGQFPTGWAEWNDRYRDAVRSFWLGEPRRLSELGLRLSGSADHLRARGKPPAASINFVTAHDGFTLEDLVSYQRKDNFANGEGNRDGSDHNLSNNFGVEGPTENPAIKAIRRRQKKNILATLFTSLGTPMLLAGDEMGRTQRGNNNAYAQDNDVSWVNWNLDQEDRELLDFVARLGRPETSEIDAARRASER